MTCLYVCPSVSNPTAAFSFEEEEKEEEELQNNDVA
jgi:hypothetical protein